MMKNIINACMFILVSLSVTADAAVLNLAASKWLLQQKNESISMILQPIDAGHTSDKEYIAKANIVNNAYKACMNPDIPPVGSPIEKFHKFKSAQLGDYCSKLTVAQCIDKVHSQQVAYCRQKVTSTTNDKTVREVPPAASDRLKTYLRQRGTESADLKSDLLRLSAEKSALEARKKQLEVELIKIFGELAANEAAIIKARQNAEKEFNN